ncbi:reverse transcriptase domain-containing protein [Bizionia paragorgiae]|uniref:reverse transcriptase domain-containing protein n=1 Tax=Flavobacteriaceae TaxID=49546 RepID=UPI003A92B557
MKKASLYSDEIWDEFCEKFGTTEEEFNLKKYPQFDPYYDFFNSSSKLKKLVSDSSLKSVSQHSFLPFVKILTKTPRYRYQKKHQLYGLETKIRPIAFASHFDTYLYAFYSYVLTEKYQDYIIKKGFSDSVLAYRTDLNGKCNIQFAKQAFDDVRKHFTKNGECAVIALDITGYFDNIDHFTLKEKWCKIIDEKELPIDQYKVFRSLTKYNYVRMDSILKHFKVNLKEKKKAGERWQTLLDLIPDSIAGKTFKNKFDLIRNRRLLVTNQPKKMKDGTVEYRGIPQGSSMSALLSNIYLIDFDKWLFDLGKKNNFKYYRYCDDLLIVCDTNYAKTINDLVLKEIKKYKLVIQDKKTEYLEFKRNSKGKIRSFNKKKINLENASLSSVNEQKYYKNLQYLGFEYNGENIYIRPGSLSRYFRKMKGRIVKTVMMTYSKHGKSDKIFKKQLYERYSHLGKRNFLSYARNSAKKTYKNSKGVEYEGMNSKSIKRQLSAHFGIIEREVVKTSMQRYSQEPRKTQKRKEKGKRRKIRTYKE